MDIGKFKQLPIMGIVRGLKKDQTEPFFEAVIKSGLKTLEFTMNSPDSLQIIQSIRKLAKDSLTVGAGTVLSLDDAKRAIDAGATFIVSPVLVNEIVDHCHDKAIAVFPGAFSPQEIYTAWCQGASMVKVFPAKFFGPAYFKEVKAPLDQVELLACGGVNHENLKDYLSSGASAVAFGSSIFRKDWLNDKKFDQISLMVKNLVQAFKDLK